MHRYSRSACSLLFLLLGLFVAPRSASAIGVTVITHGFNGDVNGWVTGMADRIPNYATFPGTNFTAYTVTLTTDGTSYFYSWARTNGNPLLLTDSGEIIVKLDWSQMAGGSAPYDIPTFTVANIAAYVLMQTNAISDLAGHALAEFPLHLIGHSRGGSLVSELSRQLGTNGIWVDHLTTLDPHPLNNDGFSDPISVTDAPVRTYVNVLYHDNYWQHLGDGLFVPNGEPVFGAYVRQLTTLSGGYSSSHSDVHLWYHGTIDWRTPTSDTEASLSSAERTNWWSAYEQRGTNAGFEYSLIGTSNRLSSDMPRGIGFPAIRDGFNQWWDLGIGVSSNRTLLTTNNGSWPNLVKLDRTDINQVIPGQSIAVKYYYQWAKPISSNAIVSFYLDDHANPFFGAAKLLYQTTVPATSSNLNAATISIPLFPTNASPGRHYLFASISGAGRSRYLYAPQAIQVVPGQQPPTLDISVMNSSQVVVGINGSIGQTIILQSSADLARWQPLTTNTLSSNRWLYTNGISSGVPAQYFRAVLGP